MFVYQQNGINIYLDKELCSVKQEMLSNLFMKHRKTELSETLSEYYRSALETIKMIKQHILYNDIFIKNTIVYYNCNEEYKYDLKQIIADVTIYLFANINDELEIDIDENQIRNYCYELEDLTAELLRHSDIHNMAMTASDE
tara:strand:+ start:4011 stop:4436 length:426 start_codon:yes stop_codon:yes gene_type:complete